MSPEKESVINTALSSSTDVKDLLKQAGLKDVSDLKSDTFLSDAGASLKALVGGNAAEEEVGPDGKPKKNFIEEALGKAQSIKDLWNQGSVLAMNGQTIAGVFGDAFGDIKDVGKAIKKGNITGIGSAVVTASNSVNKASEIGTVGFIGAAGNSVPGIANSVQDIFSDNATRAQNQHDRLYGGKSTNAVASASEGILGANKENAHNNRNKVNDANKKINQAGDFLSFINTKIGKNI
jgi:hypothetical protein